MPSIRESSHVAAVRAFNRFYTTRIGVLDRGYLHTQFSLAETRVMYELCHRREPPSAADLSRELGIDPGYMSRILRGFARRGLLDRRTSTQDARRQHLSLSTKGRKLFAELDQRASGETRALVDAIPASRRRVVIDAMQAIRSGFGAEQPVRTTAPPFTLRTHRPGDMGWVTHRHGVLYAKEYGWDETFEALVARICADFIDNLDPERERCWIAERDGEIVGSIFCVRQSKTVAKLRLLLVEPSARGLGVGRALIGACIEFTRSAGYRKLTLWTQNNLHAARHLYQLAGFKLAREAKHRSFGKQLVAQVWDLAL